MYLYVKFFKNIVCQNTTSEAREEISETEKTPSEPDRSPVISVSPERGLLLECALVLLPGEADRTEFSLDYSWYLPICLDASVDNRVLATCGLSLW